MRSVVVIIGMLAMVACCGDNIHNNPPDATPMDAAIDSPPDAFVECNYTEMMDTNNDYLATPPQPPEETGINFKPGDTRTVCGTVNNGHFSASEEAIDIDDYHVQIGADSDVLVTLIAANGQSIPSLGIFAYNDDTMLTIGFGYYIGDHAVFSAHLPAGTYEFSVEAYGNADVAASIPYKLRIQTDNPATRCPQSSGTANYTESMDGINSNMNDVYAIDLTQPKGSQVTVIGGTSPEPTNLQIANGSTYLIDGVSDSVVQSGSYFDRDTYAITATSDQMTIRVDWADATDDLDFFIFTPDDAAAIDYPGETDRSGTSEFGTQAVNPGSEYWVWVGAYAAGSTTLPENYTITICGETGVTGP